MIKDMSEEKKDKLIKAINELRDLLKKIIEEDVKEDIKPEGRWSIG